MAAEQRIFTRSLYTMVLFLIITFLVPSAFYINAHDNLFGVIFFGIDYAFQNNSFYGSSRNNVMYWQNFGVGCMQFVSIIIFAVNKNRESKLKPALISIVTMNFFFFVFNNLVIALFNAYYVFPIPTIFYIFIGITGIYLLNWTRQNMGITKDIPEIAGSTPSLNLTQEEQNKVKCFNCSRMINPEYVSCPFCGIFRKICIYCGNQLQLQGSRWFCTNCNRYE